MLPVLCGETNPNPPLTETGPARSPEATFSLFPVAFVSLK